LKAILQLKFPFGGGRPGIDGGQAAGTQTNQGKNYKPTGSQGIGNLQSATPSDKALKGRSSQAQGVSPWVMIIPEISPERAMQPASLFQGFCLYRSASLGLRPGLCCWTLSGLQLQSYSSAIRFISPFSHYKMRD
jgi:hypothetical protein